MKSVSKHRVRLKISDFDGVETQGVYFSDRFSLQIDLSDVFQHKSDARTATSILLSYSL